MKKIVLIIAAFQFLSLSIIPVGWAGFDERRTDWQIDRSKLYDVGHEMAVQSEIEGKNAALEISQQSPSSDNTIYPHDPRQILF